VVTRGLNGGRRLCGNGNGCTALIAGRHEDSFGNAKSIAERNVPDNEGLANGSAPGADGFALIALGEYGHDGIPWGSGQPACPFGVRDNLDRRSVAVTK